MTTEELMPGAFVDRTQVFVAGDCTVSGYRKVQTGLTEVKWVSAELDIFPVVTHMEASTKIADQTTDPGEIEIYVTVPTSISTDATPTTAATGERVRFLAWGTKQ
jgi:hypothetical protein